MSRKESGGCWSFFSSWSVKLSNDEKIDNEQLEREAFKI